MSSSGYSFDKRLSLSILLEKKCALPNPFRSGATYLLHFYPDYQPLLLRIIFRRRLSCPIGLGPTEPVKCAVSSSNLVFMPHSAKLPPAAGGVGLTLALIAGSVLTFAQSSDVLYQTNGRVVPGTVETVSADSIYYRPAGSSEEEPLRTERSAVALIFRDNGEFLLASQPESIWKAGANPAYDHIVEIDGRVLPAHRIEQHEDIIYYQDALDSTDASVRVAETMAIVYRDGSHQLLANANEVAQGLSRATDFPDALAASDAVASTERVAAPPQAPTAETASVEVAPETETLSASNAAIDTTQALATSTLRTSRAVREELELDRVDYEEYAAKAINKAEYLGYYLDLLCNRQLDMYDKDQAIANALQLFVHDSTRVQVSSVTRDQTTAYKIKDYLKRLSLLNYDKVELLWRNLQYVTKFRLAPDGNYYGTITVEQLFRGFRDGRAIYEDITQKDVEIVLGNFRKEESGAITSAWDVLLSDIGVEETHRR